jgi:ligand-binding sensor domain-containing protein/serine phosphatase RsbU (regulator of sigma subunit)
MPLKAVTKRQTISLVWIIIITTFSIGRSEAQNYFFDTYGIKSGLSEQKVYTLLQDSKDYLWLGTANGLSRFDGKKFENFYSRNGLAPGGVKCIAQDSLGYIWFGHMNGGGISRFDGQKFEQVIFDSIPVTGDITGIAIVKNKIWFTSATDGAIQCDFPIPDIKKTVGRQFRGKEKLSDQVFGLNVNRNGSLICITDAGLRRYNREGDTFENYRMPHLTTYFSTTCLLEDSKGNIWFGTYNGGIYKYVMSESRMVFYDLIKLGFKSNTVSCITEDGRGEIWVGTFGGGIAVFDGETIQRFDESNGLRATRIYDIIEDKEGNIFIADYDNGLTIYKGSFFIVNDKEILSDPTVNAVYLDNDGSLWLGTNAGITRYYRGHDKKTLSISEKDDFRFEDIRFIKEARDGNIWIGSKNGLVLYDIRQSAFVVQKEINAEHFTNDRMTAMELDRQNRLWLGTDEGVIVGAGEHYLNSLMGSFTIGSVTSLFCDPTGNMWIGAEPGFKKPGLIKYDVQKKEFLPIYTLSGIIPRAMDMDADGVLWIGTNEGLKAFKNDSIILNITIENGLLSDIISLLKIGKDGSIYIGTNKGLNRYFPKTGRIFSYTGKNGFTGIETKSNAVFESPSGELWFGTADGAIQIVPDKIPVKAPEPLTYITGLKVNLRDETIKKDMKLKHNMNNLQFEFYSISFSNPDIVRYKIKLKGADMEWQVVPEQNRAVYSSLASGKYTFMVMACNSQGIWSKEPVSVAFTIKPPFYFSWWFILLSIILILIAIAIYIKIREKNLVREKLLLEEKVEERTAEVVQKSMIIEEKNRDITASIRYAERIQRAMLPSEEMLPDSFVLYFPKDIVSGDFYWMYDNGESLFLAAVDCTGHGVPGAFMSIIGFNSLNKVVRELGFTKPSAIMDQLNSEVTCALLQRYERSITDGMDLALISYNRKAVTLEYAGAYSPLYIVRNGEVFVYKGDRFGIGMSAIDRKKQFTNHEIEIQAGDMIYLCSDGYADQFGGNGARKFKSGSVRKLLSEIYNLSLPEQKLRLEKEFMDWKGDYDQVDDVMFIGMKVSGS